MMHFVGFMDAILPLPQLASQPNSSLPCLEPLQDCRFFSQEVVLVMWGARGLNSGRPIFGVLKH